MTTPPAKPGRSFATSMLHVGGWVVTHTPEFLWRGVSVLLGEALLLLLPRRRYLTLSNLQHAFPDKSPAELRRIARQSSRLLIETALLSLASPLFSEDRIRSHARLSPRLDAYLRSRHTQPRPLVFATLHAAHWEAQVWIGLLSPVPVGEFGVIFRPLKQAPVDAYVKRTRERFGLQLLSRRAGFQTALRILRQGGTIGLLFDQNAGDEGSLTLLFNRVCATSELAGILSSKFNADLLALYPRRTGFWRVELDAETISYDGTSAGATLALNRWLEASLSSHSELCAAWLWAHARWRNQDRPHLRFRLEQKRDLLAQDLHERGLTTLPRRTRFFIRLPNWLGDVVMALPLLRALRQGRPDAELTLIGKAAFAPLIAACGLADRYEPLPPRGLGYFTMFRRWRHRYPDTYLLFTQSLRGDLEAWLTGCRQRFGLLRRGRRPLLTHAFHPAADYDETTHHQLELWTDFFRHFGLQEPITRSPLPRARSHTPGRIGLIAGSENTPAKRWPISHWRALIEALPEQQFVLFGTANDRSITQAIAAGFAPTRVEDQAGKTDLPTYMQQLQACEILVTNDTGGMHLANALGVPLIALFGPTNPVRTGPVFDAPFEILQPPGCPPTGGARLADLSPASVVAAVARMKAS
jgi:heptosyltransferase II